MAGRFEDMRRHMKCFVESKLQGEYTANQNAHKLESQPMLSEKERNLLSVAYKSSLAPHRCALQAARKILSKEEQEGNLDKATCAKEYILRLKTEAERICNEVLGLLKQIVLKMEGSERSEDIVFYQKMQGDYYRHLAEVVEGTVEREKAVKLSRWNYDQAEVLAERDLEITNPMRLAVALNYSIFIAECDDHAAARLKARRSYHAALEELDNIPEAREDRGKRLEKHEEVLFMVLYEEV